MKFTVSSEAFKDGKIADLYGQYSEEREEGVPQRSFPMQWEGAPEGTKSYAIVFVDYDNVIGEGFVWLHWLAANIPAEKTGLAEDASRQDKSFLQGKNTWAFQLGLDNPVCNRYGGPAPEDRPHEYELQLFALSEVLNLKDGYYYNEFLRATRGKVLDVAVMRGVYRN